MKWMLWFESDTWQKHSRRLVSRRLPSSSLGTGASAPSDLSSLCHRITVMNIKVIVSDCGFLMFFFTNMIFITLTAIYCAMWEQKSPLRTHQSANNTDWYRVWIWYARAIEPQSINFIYDIGISWDGNHYHFQRNSNIWPEPFFLSHLCDSAKDTISIDGETDPWMIWSNKYRRHWRRLSTAVDALPSWAGLRG